MFCKYIKGNIYFGFKEVHDRESGSRTHQVTEFTKYLPQLPKASSQTKCILINICFIFVNPNKKYAGIMMVVVGFDFDEHRKEIFRGSLC